MSTRKPRLLRSIESVPKPMGKKGKGEEGNGTQRPETKPEMENEVSKMERETKREPKPEPKDQEMPKI